MANKDDGGPAFPIETTATPYAEGLSLRDWFAGHAPEPPESWLHMQRGIDRNRNPHSEPHKPAPRDDFQLTAEWKFAHADAMLRACKGRVRVKPLEWHGFGVAFIAYTIIGDYHVSRCGETWHWCFEDQDPRLEGTSAASEEAAKAAVQADYEARILAALNPAPAPAPDARQEAWQPIETAPKDGTEILTIRSNGYIAKAVWYDNPFGRKDTVIENASGKWWSVTHWMPIPAPPARSNGER